MINLTELLISFLINASWQIAAIALLATILARLLNNAPARFRHMLWAGALLLSIALPLWSVVPRKAETSPAVVKWIAEETTAQISSALPFNRDLNTSPAAAVAKPANLEASGLKIPSLLTDRWVLTALALCYLAFLLYRATRLGLLWRRTQQLKRAAFKKDFGESTHAVADRAASALGLQQVTMLGSTLAAAPGVIGGRQPVVVLPENFCDDLPDETLCSILGHEFAHIVRRDYELNLIYEFLLLPISFHPLARFIKHQIDRTRELTCDEMVTEKLLAPITHARSLVTVAGALLTPANRLLTLGIFDANILEERIMRLTNKSRRLGLRAGRIAMLSAMFVLTAVSVAISSFSFAVHANRDKSAVAIVNGVAQHPTPTFVPADETRPVQDRRNQTPPAVRTAQSELPAAEERAQWACEAGRAGDVDSIPQLISMLADDRPIKPMNCWQNGRWSPALSTFKQPSPGEQAAIALASMGTPALESLSVALSSSNSSVRRNAAWAVGELTNMRLGTRAAAVPSLVVLLSDADPWVRMAAARTLGEVRDERAGEPLILALQDNDPRVRQISAWALGEMKDKRAVQGLSLAVVSDVSTEVRIAAAEALGEIKSEKAIAALNQVLNDAEPRVRAKAKWAIAEITGSVG